MTDLPITPDLTGDVPRCSYKCPAYRYDGWGSDCRCEANHGSVVHDDHSPCIPHVRHLKVLSERRCDGCAHLSQYSATHATCPVRVDCPPDDGFCECWSPRA